MTIDTTLPGNNPLQFRKKYFRFITKMPLTDELNILGDNIKPDQVRYDLDREAAKISVLPSKEMNRCLYLTGEDLGYKSEVLRKVKFEHFPLGQVLKKIL